MIIEEPVDTDVFVNRASDLYEANIRARLRHVALSTLAAIGSVSNRDSVALSRPRVHILSLHHVLDDEIAAFRRLIATVAERHTFVSYGDAVERIRTGRIDRPYIAVAFDDGFRSAYRAAEVMEEHGATACFFVTTSAIGLSNYEDVASFCRERLQVKAMPFMTWQNVESLLQRGHTIGAHTRTHPNLATLSRAQLQDEIFGAAEDLRRRIGTAAHFAWPFGGFEHFSADAARAVFDAGFDSCASGERGAHVVAEADHRKICLRRDHLLAGWPTSHSLYFLASSSRNASELSNRWPYNLPQGR